MEHLSVNLKNCYGIKKLEKCHFHFKKSKGCLIYASNGTMKTSFAKTFLDISKGRDPKEIVHKLTPSWNIKKKETETGPSINIDPAEIFVIQSYSDDIYKDSIKFDNISFLLVKEDLKTEYDEIYKDIEKNKKNIFNKIKTYGLTAKKIEEIFLNDFDAHDGNFLELLLSLEFKIDRNHLFPVDEFKYNDLFNDKTLKFLEKEDIADLIQKYTTKYSDLVDKSEIFEKNVFTHNNAISVGKQLNDNGFFGAEHKIKLKNRTDFITSQKELDDIVQAEKKSILSESELNEWFEEIDNQLNTNRELRDLRKILEKHKELIPELNNIPEFRRKILISILNKEHEAYFELLTIYKTSKIRIEEIIHTAKTEKADWEEVVELFNQRFVVPFELEVSNQEDVILKDEVPVVKFKYKDELHDDVFLENDALLNVLSNGEKRALYLLNIIYEIQIKRENQQRTLIVADDIVDSFDYQNKYAIVEYLNDILNDDLFKILILTHNFDFYRTVGSRLGIKGNSFMAVKDNDKINIIKGGKYHENIFKLWKKELENEIIDQRVLIATIPFVRNLVEYIGSDEDHFDSLTNLLHIKEDTKSFKLSELNQIYKDVWNLDFKIETDSEIFDIILDEAENIHADTSTNLKLENKIALSIAIRLLAEEVMINKITDKSKIAAINRDQTRKLFNEYKNEFEFDPLLKSLEQVNLMTPENIHLNSFMYEPILDMSDNHLRNLYTQIKEAHDARDST
ncbi:hypothetical protein BK007_10060 [Methanobacterium subterraneum]|uniref:Phage infection protein n=1 Tax=Methanobacterium subterraneum TaxID=59277 RepID=A0A2H4VDZ3_9EURY|nr:hypothetical protein [Methanobacterium subterraneum]AUB56322.1 hypothetical protein BK007_10060 [Methanobacterium subterraneum]